MNHRIFQPFPMERALASRANDSQITRWTMYMMAKVVQAILDGDIWEHYMGWVDQFHQEIIGSPTSLGSTTEDLCARISGLSDVSNISTTSRIIAVAYFSSPCSFVLVRICCRTLEEATRNLKHARHSHFSWQASIPTSGLQTQPLFSLMPSMSRCSKSIGLCSPIP